jgi:hypothetical protein
MHGYNFCRRAYYIKITNLFKLNSFLISLGGKYTEEEEVCQHIYVTLTLLRYKWRDQTGFVCMGITFADVHTT